MTEHIDDIPRPNTASTAVTSWSLNSTASIGHHVPHRQIPVIKGDVNFVNTNDSMDADGSQTVPSSCIKEVLQRLSQSPIESTDHEDAFEFIYNLFYMHSPFNQDDSRVARLLIEENFSFIVHRFLSEFVRNGILSDAPTRRSTQFILYTLWNFTGINLEFRIYLAQNKQFIEFLLVDFLSHVKNLKNQQSSIPVKENLIQSIISILHNITISKNHLNIEETFVIVNQLFAEQESTKTNERFRVTLLLCLIHLNPEQVCSNLDNYQKTFRSLFRLLKRIVQHEILMVSTGLSAWIIALAINKMPIDIVLIDDNRLISFIILFKRGMRDEKLQSSITLSRSMEKSTHAKEIIENDPTCWNLFQQYKISLNEEQTM